MRAGWQLFRHGFMVWYEDGVVFAVVRSAVASVTWWGKFADDWDGSQQWGDGVERGFGLVYHVLAAIDAEDTSDVGAGSVWGLLGEPRGGEISGQAGYMEIGDGWKVATPGRKTLELVRLKLAPSPPPGRDVPNLILKLPSGKKRDFRFFRGSDLQLDGRLLVFWVGYNVTLHRNDAVTLVPVEYEVFGPIDAAEIERFTDGLALK